MKLSEFYSEMQGWTPVDSTALKPPQIPNPETQATSYLRAILPLPLQYSGDTVKQYLKPGLSRFRIAPLGPSGIPAVNAAAAGVAQQILVPSTTSIGGGVQFQGDWNSTTSYAVDDVVIYNRSTYVALIASTNVEPDTSADIDFGQAEATWAVLGENINLRGTFDNSTAFGTATYVQSKIGNVANIPLIIAFDSANIAHNCVLVAVYLFNSTGTVSGITSSVGNTYTFYNKTQTVHADHIELWIAEDIGAGTDSLTVSLTSYTGGVAYNVIISEWGSVPTSGVIDNFNAVASSDTTAPTISLTANTNNERVVLFFGARDLFGSTETGTPPAGYIEFEEDPTGNEQKAGARGVQATHGTFAVGYTFSHPPIFYYLIGVTLFGKINTILYHPYDAILFNGSAYLCLVPTSLSPADEPTSWGLLASGVASGGVNKQTGSYLAVASDSGKLLAFNISGSATLTLPVSPPSTGWFITVENYGTATLTVSPNSLNLDGSASSISVFANQGLLIYTDGTNYFSERGMSSGGIRHTTLFTTVGTLTPNQIESNIWTIAKSFVMLVLTVGSPARVRLYSTTAFRDADVARPATTSPTPGTQNGVIMDVVLTAATGLTWVMSPSAWGSNGSGTPTTSIGYNVTNLDTVSEQVQVTLTYITEE